LDWDFLATIGIIAGAVWAMSVGVLTDLGSKGNLGVDRGSYLHALVSPWFGKSPAILAAAGFVVVWVAI